MAEVDISILIPTHNRAAILARALESISEVEIPQGCTLECVVVANACSDETLAVVQDWTPRMPFPLRCVDEPQPGLNIARNRCIAESSGEIIAFLDDDVWVEQGWLIALFDAFNTFGAHLAAGRVTLWWDEVPVPRWNSPDVERLLSNFDLGDTPIALGIDGQVVGANFAFRRSVLARVSGFARGLDRAGRSLLSGGDTEFASRVLDAGFHGMYVPEMAVRHWVAPYRANIRYLGRLAQGRGQTRVVLSKMKGNAEQMPLLVLGLKQVVKGLLGVMKGAIQLDITGIVKQYLIWSRGLGTLQGLFQ